MDQPTESISPRDLPGRQVDGRFGGPERRCLPQRAMRAVAVVMFNVLGRDSQKLPTSEGQHPIQQSRRTVPTHRSA
jgi:hypothetical protein